MDRVLHLAVKYDDPRQSSMTSKVYHTSIPCLVGFLVCYASTTTVPAVTQLQDSFEISYKVALLPFTLFILGLGCGPLIGAPISENFGRRPVYWLSVPMFGLFILGGGLSNTYTLLLIWRFLAGTFGGSAIVVGFGLLADIWPPAELPVALSIFNTVPFLGPSAGQLVSALVMENHDWRWTQWVTLSLTLVTWLTILPMSEVHLPTILRKRRRNSNVPSQTTEAPLILRRKLKNLLSSVPLLRPLHMLVVEPVVCLFALYVSFNFAAVYCFSSSIPFAFQTVYHFGSTAQGLVLLSLTIGYLLAAPTMAIPYYFHMKSHEMGHATCDESQPRERKSTPPEHLLWPALLGSVAMPISFFWFGWTAKAEVHWICPTIGLALFAWGNDLLYNAAQLYLLDTYGSKYGASATAANNLLRYCLAAILPLFMTEMYSNLGVNWAASLLGFILVLFLPIPWAFRKYGPWLREHSLYVTQHVSSE